jgi:hypothetical protein
MLGVEHVVGQEDHPMGLGVFIDSISQNLGGITLLNHVVIIGRDVVEDIFDDLETEKDVGSKLVARHLFTVDVIGYLREFIEEKHSLILKFSFI